MFVWNNVITTTYAKLAIIKLELFGNMFFTSQNETLGDVLYQKLNKWLYLLNINDDGSIGC